MGALGGSGPCGRAEAFYYDYLRDREEADIPSSVIDHIEECDHCRKRIRRLEGMLSEADGGDRLQQCAEDRELVQEFKQHFTYLDDRVGCHDVKCFLPSLLALASRIRIVTPISAHVDRCRQCARDLKALSALNLEPEQLSRLKRVYTADFEPDSTMCRKAQSKIAAFTSGAFEEIGSDLLDHFCLCPNCRREVYEYRQALRSGQGSDCPGSEEPSGDGLTMAQIFDLVVPYGLLDASSRAEKFDASLREHIRSCPECFEMMQLLHLTAYGIAERADSDVVTVYSMDDLDNDSIGVRREDDLAGHEVVSGRIESAAVVSKTKRGDKRRRFSRSAIKPYMKVAFLAAAMIPLAILVDMTVPLAFGLNIKQVNQTVAKVSNVHVSVCVPGRTSPLAEYWCARDRKIYIEETDELKTVYDLATGQKVTLVSKQGRVRAERAVLSQDESRRLERFVPSLFEVSFQDCPEQPELRLMAADSGKAGAALEIYEITWPSRSLDGSSIPTKLWISIDSEKRRPREVKVYQPTSPEETEEGGALKQVKEFRYPGEMEILWRAMDIMKRAEILQSQALSPL